MLLHPLNKSGGVVGSCEVLGDVDAEELKTDDSLYCSSVEVNRQLLRFAYIEGEVVVLAPQCQFTDLLPIG
jgi:hypothetical protein